MSELVYPLGNACTFSENVIFNHPVKSTRENECFVQEHKHCDGVPEIFNVLDAKTAMSSHVYICQFDG